MLVEVILFVGLIILLVKLNQRPKGLPPGEWGLPILGYFSPKGERLADTIDRLKEKHGDIFIAKFGARVTVFLCNYETVKNWFSKISTSGRVYTFSFRLMKKSNNTGLIMCDGYEWHTNRRFALKALKELGFGKSTIEDTVQFQVEYLIRILKENTDKPFKIGYVLNVVILNVIWGIVAGKKFSIEDEEISMFTNLFRKAITLKEGPMKILDLYPWIIPYVPKFVQNSFMKVDQVTDIADKLMAYLMEVIKECKKTLDTDNPRHFIDMYLIDQIEQKNDPYLNYRTSDYSDLIATLMDIFMTGNDTSTITLRWLFLYMAKNQDVQKKIQQEIDSVVPRSRLPKLDDKNSLPYTEAAIYELHRIVSLIVRGVGHEATEDIVIDGYDIPKGTILSSCIQSIQHNSKYWEKPKSFNPEHFLDSNGKFSIPKEGFMAFGLGLHQCLGEQMAKMEMFLFTSAILQNFEISELKDSPITLEPIPAIHFLNAPREQDIFLKFRK